MKKSSRLLYIFLVTLQTAISGGDISTLTIQQKEAACSKVHTIIRADRTRFVLQLTGTVAAGVVWMMRSSFFSKEVGWKKGTDFYLDNADGKWSTAGLNFMLWGGQAIGTSFIMGFLTRNIFPAIKMGQWDFTLKEFIEKHTRLYEVFEQVNTQASSLMYQTDYSIRETLVDSLAEKIKVLAETLSYIDGYALLRMKQLENDSKFNAKAQLMKDYVVYEKTREIFISKLLAAVESLRIESEATDFQNKVLNAIQLMQQGSHNLHNCVQALNFHG